MTVRSAIGTILIFSFTISGLYVGLRGPSTSLATPGNWEAAQTLVSYVQAAISILVIVFYRQLRKGRPQGMKKLDEMSRVATMFTALLIFGWVAIGWICISNAMLQQFLRWATDPKTSGTAKLIICIPASFTAGIILFSIRLLLRTFYGVTEVAVGLLVTARIIYTTADKPLLEANTVLGLLTAGVYLVVRGLDNIYIGWNAERPDGFARFLRRWLYRAA